MECKQNVINNEKINSINNILYSCMTGELPRTCFAEHRK